MNNAQKKVASDAGFSKFLKLCNELYLGYGECYVGDDERKDRLIKTAYLQGWNDAEDANEPKVTWSNGLLVGKTVAKMEVINDDAELVTLTFTDGSCLCVVYKAYAP